MLHKNFIAFQLIKDIPNTEEKKEETPDVLDLESFMVDDSKFQQELGGMKKGKGEDDEEEMEEVGEGDPVSCIKAFKAMIVSILEDNQMNDKRACKMEIIDFLNLLRIFNEKGVHFK